MASRHSKDIAKGNLIVPSHHPLPGVDEGPIDAGATSGAQLPDRKNGGKTGRTNQGGDATKGVELDSDNPISP